MGHNPLLPNNYDMENLENIAEGTVLQA